MIRYAFICNKVLQVYQNMRNIVFPINPIEIMQHRPDIKFISYEQCSSDLGIPKDLMSRVFKSKCGCTKFITDKSKYLVFYNTFPSDTVPGRIRWTLAHELGHINLGHFQIPESILITINEKELELEADYFAATLLCPMPLFKSLDISSPADIRSTFGLSAEAANNRWNDYLKWQRGHKKTAFENDLVRLYRIKHQS